MRLEKYSIGLGDRFGLEGPAQLRALQKAEALGVRIVPVWNKSNREHTIIGTAPNDVRIEADNAVRECGWNHSHYVDADHIGLATVDKFIESSDFYTIDVADYIGKPASAEAAAQFVHDMSRFIGTLRIPRVPIPIVVTDALLVEIARKYLFAVEEAGKVYRRIALKKGSENFVSEVSFDEAERPQTPAELFFILAAIAREGIPLQTIAPKFTGAFLKGIDYVGDISRFAREFDDDLAVIEFAVKTFELPDNLKLSVHSGSDKFSLYPIMYRAIKNHDAGLHLKTAGTTWLEEVIGLAQSGGNGLALAKEIYARAFVRYDELCKPYLPVIDIDKAQLPAPHDVQTWSSQKYVSVLQHEQSCQDFSIDFRQFVHVSFRVAAEMGERYLLLLRECRGRVEDNVTTNIFERHLQPLFLGHEVNRKSSISHKNVFVGNA
jgi:hypothetical protein